MALSAENISQALFQTSIADISEEYLKQLVANEPYYGAAHFLLAKKMFTEKEDSYDQALQKAALHFSNELLLWYNLSAMPDFANDFEVEAKPIPPIAEEEKIVANGVPEIIKEEEINVDGVPEGIADEEFPEEEEPLSEIAEDAILNDKLSTLLKEQMAAFEKPVEANVEIPVEAVIPHRIDYFESQGIKLENESGNDKLGNQLKRFTDWLKEMKSINTNPTELRNDKEGEHQVENIAQHSNEAGEIVTETMAEVLVKQGKPEQAVKIYEKLSFIYPSKSAYFAAKIEELKVR